MVSYLQRLALPLMAMVPGGFALAPMIEIPGFAAMPAGNHRGWTKSKHTVAQNRRAAAKTRARKRAKRLGQA